MSMDMDMGGHPTKMTVTSTTFVRNPDRLRIESKASMGGGVTIVSDGEFTWTYISMLKQYTKKAAIGGPMAAFQSFGFGQMPDAAKLAEATRTIRADVVEVDGQKHDCWVLETRMDVLPLPAPPGAQLRDLVMTRWMDKALLMDLRSEMTAKMDAGPMKTNMRQEMRTHGLQFDQPLADSLFQFTPPEGSREVEKLAGPGGPKSDLAGKQAPKFHLTSIDGAKLDSEAWKGKPVLLDFWTTWCAPCRKDLPVLEKIYNEHREQGLVVIGVNGGEEAELVRKFLAAEHISYPVALTEGSDILAAYGVAAFPTYVLIGADGKIAGHQIGSQGERALLELVGKAVKRSEEAKP
jgi:thiol-disulfide isomerase/thioredoxin